MAGRYPVLLVALTVAAAGCLGFGGDAPSPAPAAEETPDRETQGNGTDGPGATTGNATGGPDGAEDGASSQGNGTDGNGTVERFRRRHLHLAKPYAATTLTASCDGAVRLHPGGGACFEDLTGAETNVTIRVEDEQVDELHLEVAFEDADGATLARRTICGSEADLAVPDGTRTVLATLGPWNQVRGPPDEGAACPGASQATRGVVHANFTLDGPPTPVRDTYVVNKTGFNEDYASPHLDVLVVPPGHGPAVTYGHEPRDVGAATGGTYVDATLEALDRWMYGVDAYARDHPEYRWFSQVSANATVVAEDDVGPADVREADILVTYPETAGLLQGLAYQQGRGVGPQCVVVATPTFTPRPYSLSYTDMVALAGHELGHCLGVGHPADHLPREDWMAYESYPVTEKRCPSNLDLATVASAFAATVDPAEAPETPVRIDAGNYTTYCPAG